MDRWQWYMLQLFFFATSVDLCLAQVATPTIVDPPMSIVLNQRETFTCMAIANFITWLVNNQSISDEQRNAGYDDSADLVILDPATNLRSNNLTVLGTIANNGSIITCSTVLLTVPPLFARSSPIEIFVKFPDPPQQVNFTSMSINSTTVLISWSPPFTLEGVPILGYNVTITNTASGLSETISVDGDTTMLYYSIDNPDPDNNFTITVIAFNVAGAGQPATLPHTFPVLIVDMPSSTHEFVVSLTPPLSSASSANSIIPSTTTTPTGEGDTSFIVILIVVIISGVIIIVPAIITITIVGVKKSSCCESKFIVNSPDRPHSSNSSNSAPSHFSYEPLSQIQFDSTPCAQNVLFSIGKNLNPQQEPYSQSPFEQKPNPVPKPYEQEPDPQSSIPKPYEQEPDLQSSIPYEQEPDPQSSVPKPHEQEPDPQSFIPKPYEQEPVPQSSVSKPYEQKLDPQRSTSLPLVSDQELFAHSTHHSHPHLCLSSELSQYKKVEPEFRSPRVVTISIAESRSAVVEKSLQVKSEGYKRPQNSSQTIADKERTFHVDSKAVTKESLKDSGFIIPRAEERRTSSLGNLAGLEEVLPMPEYFSEPSYKMYIERSRKNFQDDEEPLIKSEKEAEHC